jgi:two-component sensor histidine kinase
MTQDDSQTDRIAELDADNRRLRRLLEQRDAPGELRHRLRGTVALLRAIIRKSAATPRDLESHTHHIEGRLDALARAQAEADERGGSNLHSLITDELLQYAAAEGERLVLSGPELRLTPRAGQIFALGVHELAVNSVEHGVLGAGGRLEISWDVEGQDEGKMLTFTWHEIFKQAPPEAGHAGFGTEVLTSMFAYDLGAKTKLDLDQNSLTCTINLPFDAKFGSLMNGGS